MNKSFWFWLWGAHFLLAFANFFVSVFIEGAGNPAWVVASWVALMGMQNS